MDGKRRPVWPSDVARDIDEEIASHLEERREEYLARGLDPDEAAEAAAKKFGNRAAIADVCRRIDRDAIITERRRHMHADLRQDIGYALRLLRRSPGFAATAIVTLALGMGATTTIFTLANWALLRPVPGVTDPANVSVFWVGRHTEKGGFSPARLSYPNLADVSARVKTISLGGYQGGATFAVAGGGQGARNLSAQFVTAGYFDVLGVRMQLGRPFTAAEDTPPAPLLAAVISDRLWRSMFQRDPDVLQKSIEVAGRRFAILGVAPPAFHGTERLSTTDLWLPGASSPIVRHMPPTRRYDARATGAYFELVARLAPGATWPQAQAEMDSLRAWLRDEYPTDNSKFSTTGFHRMGPIGPPPFARDLMKRVIGLTTGSASALVMLIACANVAGLLMIRGIGRRGEIGVRKALGAGRGRLIRQQVAEGLLLWVLGGAGAVVFLLVLRRMVDVPALLGMGSADMLPPVDWRVLAFTGLVSLVVGLVFSIGPAIRATGVEAAETLRSAGPTATRRMLAGTSLAVFQLSASLTLLVGALLLVGTLRHLARVPLGFDADGVFVFAVQPASIGYNDAASLEYLDEFQRRLTQTRGVRRVAAADGAPFFGGINFRVSVRPAAAALDGSPLQAYLYVLFSPGYFDTLGIPLVRGRTFVETDFAAARRGEFRGVILSDGLSRRLFGEADPIGRELVCPGRPGGQRCQVIGIVGGARYRSLVGAPDDTVFEPAPPGRMSNGATIIARTNGSVALAEEARRIAAALSPALPLTTVSSMEDAVGQARREWDSLARLLGILALLAAVLACVGLYSVVAHSVAQRRREFGIRAALGAARADVWGLVLRQSATIVGAGVAFGLIGSYVFAQSLSARLFGVNPLDPVLWAVAVGLLVVVAAAASIRPAVSATRVDVNETLRAL
jgi:putative ABC transport system permease protein